MMSKETAEIVRQEVAFQGYFKVVRYFFRHTLHNGGMSGEISREVFERGQAGGRRWGGSGLGGGRGEVEGGAGEERRAGVGQRADAG